MNVVINPETCEKKDIINFYNEVYIKIMKDYIIATKNTQAVDGNGISGTRTPVISSQGNITPSLNKP